MKTRISCPSILRTSLCTAGAILCLLQQADGASRRLEIEIEPIIMLNCVERVDYSLDTARILTSGAFRTAAISAAGTTAASARMIEARLSADNVLRDESENGIEIDVEKACSVRGLGRGEGFIVNVAPSRNGVLRNARGDGLVVVQDAKGRPSYGGGFSRRFTIPQNRIRLDTPITIDVQLRVDLRLAADSGQYSSPVDGVFSIEVSAP